MTTQELQELLQLNHGVAGDSLNFNSLKTAILDFKDTAGYEYIEVPVSSDEILTMGSTPIVLLAAPGESKYHEIDTIILEYSKNTTYFTAGAVDNITIYQSNGRYLGFTTPGFLTGSAFPSNTTERLVQFKPQALYAASADATTGLWEDLYALNDSVVLTTSNGNNFSVGDGTILAKIWYKVKTFGTEL